MSKGAFPITQSFWYLVDDLRAKYSVDSNFVDYANSSCTEVSL